jgi:beta-phosphoglucomutase-like phosphatase (HAD superfamily)
MPELPGSQTIALLCDADGNLFPSEEPAFVASAVVTNDFLAALGIAERVDAEQLRLTTTGKNFRTTAADLAGAHVTLTKEVLDHWVQEEKMKVTAYLAQALRPDPSVVEPLSRLSASYRLAAVSSSALSRLAACFDATQLSDLIPPNVRFSAEDSLARPTSKPDPAVYLHACAELGIDPGQAVAVEDSVPGAQSAVAAGIPTAGNVQFVAPAERSQRIAQLQAVGVFTVVDSWSALEKHLQRRAPASAHIY